MGFVLPADTQKHLVSTLGNFTEDPPVGCSMLRNLKNLNKIAFSSLGQQFVFHVLSMGTRRSGGAGKGVLVRDNPYIILH